MQKSTLPSEIITELEEEIMFKNAIIAFLAITIVISTARRKREK